MNNHSIEETNSSKTEETQTQIQIREKVDNKDEDMRKLEPANIHVLPLNPPAAVDSNFVAYFVPNFLKSGHDQHVYRHANGCCVERSLLEVNDRLIKQLGLLNSSADREGCIAIIMPKPADWLKIKSTLLSPEEYTRMREAC